MSDTALIRNHHGKAASFVEQKDEIVVVTVDGDRIEVSKSEWNSLPAWDGEVPNDFDKPPQQTK